MKSCRIINKLALIALGLACFLTLSSKAQPVRKPNCATDVTPGMVDFLRMHNERQKAMGSLRGGNYLIPVQLHLLRSDNGFSNITAEQVLQEFAWANEKFQAAGMEFYMCAPVHYIDDDNFYFTAFDSDWPNGCGETNAEYQMAGLHNIPDVVNIYWVNTDGLNWSAFPSYVDDYCKDWIIMNQADTGKNWLLAHELGHYFNLSHTFSTSSGAENVTRNPADPCWDCYTDGDFLCDTPADPNNWNNCDQDGNALDDCNDAYSPDPENLMSYADGCQVYFTGEQIDRMLYAAAVLRSYLSCGTLSSCEPDWNITNTQTSDFHWQASDFITSSSALSSGIRATYDATNYVKLTSGFFAPAGTEFKVILDGCHGILKSVAEEETQTSLQIAEQVSLFPNPATDLTSLRFELKRDEIISVYVMDIAGKVIQTVADKQEFRSGTHRLEIGTGSFSAGTYMCVTDISGEKHISKLVVQH